MTRGCLNKLIKKTTAFLGLFLVIVFFITVQNTCAAGYDFEKEGGLITTGEQAGYNLATPAPELVVGQIVQIILSILGVGFLGFMIYAGIIWMTAQGNEQRVEKAKNMITEAIVGIIIVSAAYAIAFFVINYFSANSLR